MAITVNKQPITSVSSLPNYIGMTSSNSDKRKFEYVVDVVFFPVDLTNVLIIDASADLATFTLQGTVAVGQEAKLNDYKKGDVVAGSIDTLDEYMTFTVSEISSGVVTLETTYNDVLTGFTTLAYETIKDDYLNATGSYNFTLNRVFRKRTSPLLDGSGLIEVNSILSNEIDIVLNDTTKYSVEFSFYTFESYVYEIPILAADVASSPLNNRFYFNDPTLDRDIFNIGDVVTIQNLDAAGNAFYSGAQTVVGFDLGGGFFDTDKPNQGIDATAKIGYFADTRVSAFIDTDPLVYRKVFYNNTPLEDIRGLNDLEVQTYINSFYDVNGFVINNYIPSTQKVALSDTGYLAVKALLTDGSVNITYTTYDSDDVLIGSTVQNIPLTADGFITVQTHPASIIATTIDCDVARYTIDIERVGAGYTSRLFEYVVQDLPRMRLLFKDGTGNYQGLNMYGVCRKFEKSTKTKFQKDWRENSGVSFFTLEETARGTTDISATSEQYFTLNSDWLTQEESDYFIWALRSSDVYIVDYEENLCPVNIPDIEVEQKSKRNGLIRYTLRVNQSIKQTYF